ncbi:Chitinase 2, partial [Basidiobolus ranarum]
PVPNPTTNSTPNPTTSSTPSPTTRSTPNPTTSSTPSPATSSTPNPTPDAGICTDIPQWNSGIAYTGNQQVIYNGSLWKAKWWTLNNEPGNNPEQVWAEVGPCDGPTTTVNPTPNPTSEGGICNDIPKWNSGIAYTGNQQVTYNGFLWRAKWWTLNNEPGNNHEDVWYKVGACGDLPKPTSEITSTSTEPQPTSTSEPTETSKPEEPTSEVKPTETSTPVEPTTVPTPETTTPVEPSKTTEVPQPTNSPSGVFDPNCNDNLAVCKGQNSFGGAGGSPSGWQKNLADYCQDDTIDIIPVAFLNTYFGKGGLPELNLANTCNDENSEFFPDSNLLRCPNVEESIKFCQSRGKSVILSLGGAGGSYGFQNDDQARDFATQLWNLFLGGQSSTRPFGDAILDGVDLDIEGGGPTGYVAFVNQLRSHYEEDRNRKYLIAAAPQCVYPDAQLSSTLNNAWFDLVFVQFYNNPCGLQYYDNYRAWNYGIWDYWATHVSPNPNVKVYIGAPAAEKAAGSGYVPIDELKTIAQETRSKFSSFGGVMFWDASQAWANEVPGGNYAQVTKQFLREGGSCNAKPDLPSCNTAEVWSPSSSYPGGSVVAHSGYIWKALWWVQGQEPGPSSGYWSAINGCSGNGSSGSVNPPDNESPPSDDKPCTGTAAWSSGAVYVGGDKVSYNGHLWQAKWWTQNDVPGLNQQDVWKDLGACNSLRRRSRRAVSNFAATKPSDFLVQHNFGNFLVTMSNLKLEANRFQMGVKITAQKPGLPISEQWSLRFPFNSTIDRVDGARSEFRDGSLVLSAAPINMRYKSNQFMSVFMDIHGHAEEQTLDKFPFPMLTKTEFSP